MKNFEETTKSVTMWMNIARMVAVMILIVFASPLHEWALDTIGGLPCICSIIYMVIPRRYMKPFVVQIAMEEE